MSRTVTKRADRIEGGDVVKVWDRDAYVVNRPQALIERGPVGTTGPAMNPDPYYWVEIEFQWLDADTDSPTFKIAIEGNRWVYTRDALDQ